jgi:hypothetical protein
MKDEKKKKTKTKAKKVAQVEKTHEAKTCYAIYNFKFEGLDYIKGTQIKDLGIEALTLLESKGVIK